MFDGDGTGDERKINMLQKVVQRWVATKNMNNEDNLNMLNKCLLYVDSIESSWIKSNALKNRYTKEVKLYQNYQQKTEKNIKGVKKKISQAKTNLHQLKQEKEQKTMYNIIAQDIMTISSRNESNKIITKLSEIKMEIANENANLNNDLSKLQNHVKLLSANSNKIMKVVEKYNN